MLQFIPNHYKTQKMCEKSVDYYPHASEYAPECYMILFSSIKDRSNGTFWAQKIVYSVKIALLFVYC